MQVVDPVCGSSFEEEDAAVSVEYRGVAYHFCGRECMEKFEGDPDTYAQAEAQSA
jgi:YHS domain-containing protein